MGECHGCEAPDFTWNAKRGVPFVFVTGYGERNLAPSYRDRPALPKPFQVEQLKEVLSKLLAT